MGAQHPSHFPHRLQAAAHRPPGPIAEKPASPHDRSVFPEMREDFLQLPGPSCLELAGQQGVQLFPGSPPHSAAAPQQGPARTLQFLRDQLARRSQTSALRPPHLIHRLVQMHRDVEAVQHLQRLAGLRRDHFQVRFPHIAADKSQTLHHARPQHLQPVQQRPLRPPLPHKQQPPAMRVDLINHRQEITCSQAAAPVDLIDSDRLHALQLPVSQAPRHEPLHRAIDRFPTHLKSFGHFAPTQPSRPTRQKPHHGRRHGPLPLVPRQVLHHHAVLRALHPPRRIPKPNFDAPQRYMLPLPLFQLVITRRRSPTPRTASAHPGVRSHSDLNPLRLPGLARQSNLLEDKSRMGLNSIQNRLNLELNGWSPSSLVCLLFQPQTNPSDGDQSFSLSRALRGAPLCLLASISSSLPRRRAKNHPQILLWSPFYQGYDSGAGDVMPTWFRQYSPLQGRWITPDPADLAAVDLTNPQSLNRYAYVGNNPTTFIDPTGLIHC